MVFDTTIVGIVIPQLTFRATVDATAGLREIRCALTVGKDTLDAGGGDFQTLYATSIGAPWMWVVGRGLQSQGAASLTLSLSGPAVSDVARIKAKRRFRENDSTVWLIHENRVNAGDTALQLKGFVRTLIYIP